MQRAMDRAAAGTLAPGPAYSFASAEAAAEAMNRALASGRPACGDVDDFCRCANRFHGLSCDHSVSPASSVEVAQAGVYARALRGFLGVAELANQPQTVLGDSGEDTDAGTYAFPATTLGNVRKLAEGLGLR